MAYENPTPAPKPLWLIADEWMMEARRLMDEDAQLAAELAQLKRENADLREALAHCPARTYGDDICDDDDSCGQFVVPQLKG